MKIGAKAAHKILVKLSTDFNFNRMHVKQRCHVMFANAFLYNLIDFNYIRNYFRNSMLFGI
jgi:hypothetical protein